MCHRLQVCVRTFAKCDAVVPLMSAMKARPDAIHLAAETIKKMYDLSIPELVVQVSSTCVGLGFLVYSYWGFFRVPSGNKW